MCVYINRCASKYSAENQHSYIINTDRAAPHQSSRLKSMRLLKLLAAASSLCLTLTDTPQLWIQMFLHFHCILNPQFASSCCLVTHLFFILRRTHNQSVQERDDQSPRVPLHRLKGRSRLLLLLSRRNPTTSTICYYQKKTHLGKWAESTAASIRSWMIFAAS